MGKQKRSENTYQKINTVFKRDINNVIMINEPLVLEELEWMRGCKFDAEEKIDGTNMRIEVTRTMKTYTEIVNNVETEDSYVPYEITWNVAIKGKTDNAQIPKNLKKYMEETFTEDKVLSSLGLQKVMSVDDEFTNEKGWVIENHSWGKELDLSKIPFKYTLYGEGYGAGIQSGGYYRQDNSYIGFDVKVDNTYLLRANRDEIFTKLGADIVPFMGQFTIDEAIEFVKKGFNSQIANEEHLAEGLVLRTPMGLCNRRGERIIFKIKTCDFQKWDSIYGHMDPKDVVQTPNTNY